MPATVFSRTGTVTALCLAAAFLSRLPLGSAQPPATPPAEKATDQLWEEVWALESLNALGLSAAQMQQLVRVADDFRARTRKTRNQAGEERLRKALWRVRQALLTGEGIDKAWAQLEAASEQEDEAEEAREQELIRCAREIAAVLTPRQQAAVALNDTPEGEVAQVIRELPEALQTDAEEWRDWRSDTAESLAELAADLDEKTAGDVEDRVLLFLLLAKGKGADYVRKNAAQLEQELINIVVPKEHRVGAEEREERLRDWVSELLEEPILLPLIREKLALSKK